MTSPDSDEGGRVPRLGMFGVTEGAGARISGDSGSAGGSWLVALSGRIGRGSGRGGKSDVDALPPSCLVAVTACFEDAGEEGTEDSSAIAADDSQEE